MTTPELNPSPVITHTDILADTLVRTLLALEVAYEYRHAMPEHVQNLLKERIEEARESC